MTVGKLLSKMYSFMKYHLDPNFRSAKSLAYKINNAGDDADRHIRELTEILNKSVPTDDEFEMTIMTVMIFLTEINKDDLISWLFKSNKASLCLLLDGETITSALSLSKYDIKTNFDGKHHIVKRTSDRIFGDKYKNAYYKAHRDQREHREHREHREMKDNIKPTYRGETPREYVKKTKPKPLMSSFEMDFALNALDELKPTYMDVVIKKRPAVSEDASIDKTEDKQVEAQLFDESAAAPATETVDDSSNDPAAEPAVESTIDATTEESADKLKSKDSKKKKTNKKTKKWSDMDE